MNMLVEKYTIEKEMKNIESDFQKSKKGENAKRKLPNNNTLKERISSKRIKSIEENGKEEKSEEGLMESKKSKDFEIKSSWIEDYKEICNELPFKAPSMSFMEKKMKFPSACLYHNWKKNRYPDILCNEKTRFLFQKQSNPNLVDQEKYINANRIEGIYDFNTNFIATQAPLESTFEEFYEMLWQEKTNLIITLANLVEDGKAKMSQFWPKNKKEMEISYFSVSLIAESNPTDQICIRKLKLKNYCSNSEREIFQIHYMGWPDQGVPKDLSSLNEIYKYQKLFEGEGKSLGLDGSPIVHCSAGIGRTATYISFVFGVQRIDSLKKENNFSTKKLDVQSIVKKIRNQRSGSVQTSDQYFFIYQTLNQYISQNN